MFTKLKQWFQKRWSKPKIVMIFPPKKKGTIEIPPYIPESFDIKKSPKTKYTVSLGENGAIYPSEDGFCAKPAIIRHKKISHTKHSKKGR